jgi:hypothetical protein
MRATRNELCVVELNARFKQLQFELLEKRTQLEEALVSLLFWNNSNFFFQNDQRETEREKLLNSYARAQH